MTEGKQAYRLTDAEASAVWLALESFTFERTELDETAFDALVELFAAMEGGESVLPVD